MADPVIVIHGVNVRDQKGFEEDVAKMNQNVGDEWTFVPVYWGDIAAKVGFIKMVVPHIGLSVRSEDADLEPLVASLLAGSMLPEVTEVRSSRDAGEIVAAAAAVKSGVRGGDDDEIRRTIEEEWENQKWLVLVRDQETLEELGRAIAEGIADEDESVGVVRGFGSVKNITKRVLRAINNALGAVITLTAGNFHQYLRGSLAPVFGRFLGDVFVYESARDALQRRLREKVNALGGGWGTEGRPVTVLAHSLGGVVTFDSAVRPDDPLHVDNFVTFGSQPAFFHVINHRYQVAQFAGKRIKLGTTIRRWLNVWQPLDPLAFSVGTVFEIGDGKFPKDVMLPHRGTDPLWTHSVYWLSNVFAGEVRNFLLGSR